MAAWADLGDDLVGRILKYLPCLAHRAVFSAVCGKWLNVAHQNPPEPRLPWLLLQPAPAQEPCFFCLLCRTTHRAALPDDVRGARWCGSALGGLLILALQQASGYACHDLHTGARILVPETLRTPGPVGDHGMVIHAAQRQRQGLHIMAALVSGSVSTIAFWRGLATDHWVPPTPEEPHARDSWSEMVPRSSIADVLDYNGHGLDGFHVLTDDEEVLVYVPEQAPDGALTMRMVTYRFPGHEASQSSLTWLGLWGAVTRYLVEYAGDLVMVVRIVTPVEWTPAFRFFKLVPAPEPAQGGERLASWVRMPVIPSGILVIGRCCSRSYPTYGIDFDGVYFLDDATSSQDAVTRALEPAVTRQYPCSDMGWVPLLSPNIQRIFPQRFPSESSRAVWFFPFRNQQ